MVDLTEKSNACPLDVDICSAPFVVDKTIQGTEKKVR